jgi:AcrR family transcriptional regulator
MQQKPFAEITVQQVLDEAKIGRSTFYEHYRDKDDLFLSDADEFFAMVAHRFSKEKDKSGRVLPVRELFQHVAEVRDFYAALIASGRIEQVMGLAQEHFARAIESHWKRAQRGSAAKQRAEAIALAAALVGMLRWWMEARMPCSAAEMDEVFHALVGRG